MKRRSTKQEVIICRVFLLPVIVVLLIVPAHLLLLDGIYDFDLLLMAFFVIILAGLMIGVALTEIKYFSETEEEMRKKGAFGMARTYDNSRYSPEIIMMFTLGMTGEIIDARKGKGSDLYLRPLEKYIGVNLEEARKIARSTPKDDRLIDVSLRALEEAEKKLRELQEEQERIRRLRSLHIEEPEDSLWEEE